MMTFPIYKPFGFNTYTPELTSMAWDDPESRAFFKALFGNRKNMQRWMIENDRKNLFRLCQNAGERIKK